MIVAMAIIRSTNLALLVIVNKTWKLLLWRGMLLALEIMLLTIRRCYILAPGVS